MTRCPPVVRSTARTTPLAESATMSSDPRRRSPEGPIPTDSAGPIPRPPATVVMVPTPPGTLAIVYGAAAMCTNTARERVTANTAARPYRTRR